MAKARKDYYLTKLGEITPREDYYLRGGHATGQWVGTQAAASQLDGTVAAEGLVRLFDGCDPNTGEQIGRRVRRDGVAAWDLTFSADKSVSLLWALGDTETQTQVLEAFHVATTEALGYMEAHASSTRGATRVPVLDDYGNPIVNDDGSHRTRVVTWPIESGGYMGASFTEFTSRAQDPQLHTHVVVANRVKGTDDVWRTIDGRLIYQHRLAAGYLHEAVLRSELTQRLGVQWQPVDKGMADIDGITRDQIEAFSQRHRHITQWCSDTDLDDSPAARRAGAIATRPPKQDTSLHELRDQWRTRAVSVGLTAGVLESVMGRCHDVAPIPEPRLTDGLIAPGGLTAGQSTFTRPDVVAATCDHLPDGGTRADIERFVDRLLAAQDVIPLIGTPPTDATDSTDISSEPPQEVEPGDNSRAAEPAPTNTKPLVRRYTVVELLMTEQRMVERGLDTTLRDRWTAPEYAIDGTLSARRHLTSEQMAMVRGLATSGRPIDVGVGPAGTGKTSVMTAIAELAYATNTPIVGAALAARAAAGLTAATGIPALTVTRFLSDTNDAPLPARGITVVDEAGMVGTRDLAQISNRVEDAKGKLILIGDYHQLPEIHAGGLFKTLVLRLGAHELSDNLRQHHAWERQALTNIRSGPFEAAIDAYRQHNRVVTVDTPIQAAVNAWHHDVVDLGDPSAVLLLGYTNATVNALNRHARQTMADTERLHGPAISADDRSYRAGDRVVCLRNKPRLGVLNGDTATIAETDPGRRSVTLLLDRDDITVTIPAWYLDDGSLDWGYAMTGHKAQGTTAERVHTIVDAAATREWTYVTISRGRQSNTIYTTPPGDQPEDCTHLAYTEPGPPSTLATAMARTSARHSALHWSEPDRDRTAITLE